MTIITGIDQEPLLPVEHGPDNSVGSGGSNIVPSRDDSDVSATEGVILKEADPFPSGGHKVPTSGLPDTPVKHAPYTRGFFGHQP